MGHINFFLGFLVPIHTSLGNDQDKHEDCDDHDDDHDDAGAGLDSSDDDVGLGWAGFWWREKNSMEAVHGKKKTVWKCCCTRKHGNHIRRMHKL